MLSIFSLRHVCVIIALTADIIYEENNVPAMSSRLTFLVPLTFKLRRLLRGQKAKEL
jgi:hypothetical protein